MPLGSYFIRKDRSSLLSYTWDGDIISLDPIHAPSDREPEAWPTFLKAFNEWAHQRGGIPLLNQSPFVKKEHVVAAYGDRWKKLGDWLQDRRSRSAHGQRVLRRALVRTAVERTLQRARVRGG